MINKFCLAKSSPLLLSILLGAALSFSAEAATSKDNKMVVDSQCPPLGWSENLVSFLKPDAKLPTENTPLGASDCDFHEWSWEAFVWATALDKGGAPRFMTLPTPDDLLISKKIKPGQSRSLKLGLRATKAHNTTPFLEVAGAIVEADGNMLVAANGYPVYASVHMNSPYFTTAKKNLIYDAGYINAPADDYFDVGAAVFKATWLRLDSGQAAPAGAFTTQATVPVLKVNSDLNVVPSGKTTQATVALVGMHVVGYTINHPEFLWGTFEHKVNVPMVPDNTFSTSDSSPNNYTFYSAGTSYADVNQQNSNPATLTFDEKTQRFSPRTNAVLENKTGGENNSPNGPANIESLNVSAQEFLENQKGNQSVFSNYNLIGTLWMKPNTYVLPGALSMGAANGVGSVNLANSTAETFVQYPNNSDQEKVQNCFMCHNATSYSFQQFPPPLANRRIALSHVLSVGTPYSVANKIPVGAQCSDVNTGPIMSNNEAQTICPKACGKFYNWNGQWRTTVQGKQSVCGCCTY